MNVVHVVEPNAAVNYANDAHSCSDSTISDVTNYDIDNNNNKSASTNASASAGERGTIERVMSATDKVRVYRDAVVRVMEAHLAGLKHASWLIILLDDYAQVHLPVKWINSPRIVREIIKPSLRRWLDLVRTRFRNRNALMVAQRQVSEAMILQRSAELREAIKRCMRQRFNQ